MVCKDFINKNMSQLISYDPIPLFEHDVCDKSSLVYIRTCTCHSCMWMISFFAYFGNMYDLCLYMYMFSMICMSCVILVLYFACVF